MIRVNEIKVEIKDKGKNLEPHIAKKLNISEDRIQSVTIFKESIDARKTNNIIISYVADIELKDEDQFLSEVEGYAKSPDLSYTKVYSEEELEVLANVKDRPVIIGAGPAGLFAALILAEAKLNPIIIERGECVEDRTKSVNNFWSTGELNTNSNVQFGEGGAGTFSDGKLTTRIKDLRARKVLDELVASGARDEILYKNKPHIGTDGLKSTVIKFRKRIEALGGEFRFNTTVEDLIIENDQIVGVKLSDSSTIEANHVVLAIGHSARDTFEMIYEKGIMIEAKPFAVGFRIEHAQQMIDQAQYGNAELKEMLGAADYKLTYQTKSKKGVYTFCMCPGGEVVASSSEEGTLVVNGMSEYRRNKANANSAILVTVDQADYGNDHPLAGMYFQREWEKNAFVLGGSDYTAPIQLVRDFVGIRESAIGTRIKPTYKPSTKFADLNKAFPKSIVAPIKEGLLNMERKIRGFASGNGILTGVETRTSSPIRILRDKESLQSQNVKGLYPCGEGSGYAGGIVSSAVDGIKVSEMIIKEKVSCAFTTN